MNSLKLGSNIKKHPLISALALSLAAFTVVKAAHQFPLQNLDKQYLEELRANDFNLSPLVRDYLKINPYNTEIETFGIDTLIIVDNTRKRTFYITCPKNYSGGKPPLQGQRVCIIREEVLLFLGAVLGSGNAIPESMVSLPFDSIQPKSRYSRGIDLNRI